VPTTYPTNLPDSRGWAPPLELDQPVPRRCKPRGSWWIFLTIAAIFAFILLFCAGVLYLDTYKSEILKARGISVNGTVVGLHTRLDRHLNTRCYVTYRIRSSGSAATSSRTVDNTELVSSAHYQMLRIGSKVPVVFDPDDITRSALNFGDVIHQTDHWQAMRGTLALISVLTGAIITICMIPICRAYCRERCLVRWGYAVPATIVGQYQHNMSGVGRTALVYRFMDAKGTMIDGARENLPGENEWERDSAREYLARFLENPTVLVDPRNSNRNLLYPPIYVACCLPRRHAESR